MSDIDLLIGGEWKPASDGGRRDVVNPANGEVVGRLAVATDADLDAALRAAAAAFEGWKNTPAIERGAILRRAATLMRQRADEFAPIITRENGKTLAESMAEVSWAADFYEWFAEEARRIYGRTVPARMAGVRQFTSLEPVGPVLALSPWNWPLVPLSRKLSAALAAGCTVIAKPAEETPSAVALLARIFAEAGLPDGVLNVVYGDPAHISSRLIAAPEVRKISFTGSVPVGRLLARQAADHLKPITLELGGHAPVIVFDDVDVDAVVGKVVPIKFRTAGQVCSSPTRFYVHEKIAARFTEKLASAASGLKVGDGAAAGTEMGPLISARRVDAVADLVADAVSRGATLVSGGQRPEGKGYYYPPTILAGVKDDARIMSEEPFGPVVPVTTFSDYDEVIARANATPYALAAYVFTQSLELAHKVGVDLNCGNLGINTFAVSLAEGPFGGNRDSGYGREGGTEGIQSYLTTKFVAESAR
ncbi:NAD-dependent succinate-semialdehyde dehydrogenase [Pelagibacterium lacus]|uniref:NAD-dependent succinate-semialdehyde dehydrogenase n=1 Tax=Pelagibacterium lacus TaxID=2282655 RepID=A0A369WEE7_9HYPH|nr:NAD-dependent succinate-semialdehyde dehydrogenase [Pelagibacterium lacus]RDE10521.1 NAD-dependent succinate-semialdehyde dehydrogenase [Pelagibacterium lacus]